MLQKYQKPTMMFTDANNLKFAVSTLDEGLAVSTLDVPFNSVSRCVFFLVPICWFQNEHVEEVQDVSDDGMENGGIEDDGMEIGGVEDNVEEPVIVK